MKNKELAQRIKELRTRKGKDWTKFTNNTEN